MIDTFLKWATEADAIAAAEAAGTPGAIGRRDTQGNWHWNLDHVNPDVKAWRISQDNTDGTHNYLAGWFCIVATQKYNNTLANDPATQFVLDRDGPPYVLKNNIGAILQDVCCEPIFAGSHYPIGGYN